MSIIICPRCETKNFHEKKNRCVHCLYSNPTSKQPKDQSTSWEKYLDTLEERFKAFGMEHCSICALDPKYLKISIKDLLASSQRELLEKIISKSFWYDDEQSWVISKEDLEDLKSQLSGEEKK